MLDDNRLVFVGAVRLNGDVGGHAWVVDGYKSLLRTTIAKNTAGQVVSTTTTGFYVHCNWGGGGSYDGWFSYNIMDNPSFSPADDYIYDRHFRIITYDKPMVE